jgi:hypothetical protein
VVLNFNDETVDVHETLERDAKEQHQVDTDIAMVKPILPVEINLERGSIEKPVVTSDNHPKHDRAVDPTADPTEPSHAEELLMIKGPCR